MVETTKLQEGEILLKNSEISTSEGKEKLKKAVGSWFCSDSFPGVCPNSKYLKGYIDYRVKLRYIIFKDKGKRKVFLKPKRVKDTGRIEYIKGIPCGKEYCYICGQKGSLLHRQRVARGLSKIKGSKALGYFVFTFPEKVRDRLLNQKVLGAFQDFVRDLFKEYPFILGQVSRWHWSGDKHKGVWNPHLNVLLNVKGGVVSKAVLNRIRARAFWWIFDHLGKIDCVWVKYSYCLSIPEMVHKWKYVTRPTMLNLSLFNKSEELSIYAQVLHNYRNTRWSGHWDKCSDVSLSSGVRILNDKAIWWEYDKKGHFLSLSNSLLDNPEWEYKGYGVFQSTRASPGDFKDCCE